MSIERRTQAGGVETREEGQGKKISGMAAVYYDGTPRTEYQITDSRGQVVFRERIMPGAFAGAGSDDVVALWNHNADKPLGRRTAGTLRVQDTSEGLRYEIDVPDTQAGRDAVVSVQRGDVTGSSFAFRVRGGGDQPGQRWIRENDTEIREVLAVEVMDVSPVTYPAYQATSGLVSARDAEAALKAYQDHRDDGKETENVAEADKAKAQAQALEIIARLHELK